MPTSPKHETKNCPRCNAEFECKSGSILLCQCQTIFLSEAQLDYNRAQFNDCLCITCLQELRTEFNCLQHDSKLQKYRQ